MLGLWVCRPVVGVSCAVLRSWDGVRYDGLGILGVKNVPGFVQKRAKLLPLAYKCV